MVLSSSSNTREEGNDNNNNERARERVVFCQRQKSRLFSRNEEIQKKERFERGDIKMAHISILFRIASDSIRA